MQHTTAQRASPGPGRAGEIAVAGEQEIVESALAHDDDIQDAFRDGVL